MKNKSVLSSILSLSFLGLIAKVFGLVREGVFAAYFGTSAQMDLFSLLTGYVTTVIAVLAISLGTAFSPYYVKSLQREGEKEASRRFSVLLNQFILFSLTVYAVIIVALPLFSNYISNKIPGVDRTDSLLFSRLIFLTIITGGCTRLFVVALNGLRKYGWMQITQLLYAVIAIVLTVIWGKSLGAIVLVSSFVINSIIQIVLLWCVFFRGEREYSFSFKDSTTNETWKALIPVFLGTETYLFGLTIDRTVGLSLGIVGAVAALNYAGVLFGMINTLITSPINTVFLTEMYRRYFKTGDREVLYSNLQENINHLSAVLVPFACFFSVASKDFITIVLQRGAFDAQSAALTSSAFCLYALASPFYAFRNIFSGVHRAMHDNITPMWSGIIFLSLNYILASVLSRPLGITGITLGSLVAMILSFLFQFIMIKRKHEFNCSILNKDFCKILFSSVIPVVAVLLLFRYVSIESVYLRFIIKGGVFLLLCFTLLYSTRCEEIIKLKKQIVKK